MPDNLVVVLLDSLNRHMLGSYGGTEFETPNLDRFAVRSTKFTNHVTGSLPCMPARHDILCGALDFLWKPWGSIELWEEAITATLQRAGVATMLVSDHPHLFETGGENYHTDFDGWEYVRGHEGDPWRTYPDPSAIGAPTELLPASDGGWYLQSRFGIDDEKFGRRHYDNSRTWFRQETDFPGPKVMGTAAGWLRHAPDAHGRWMLFVDEFDPHEPFDTPEPWASMYDDEPWTDDRLIWPPYVVGGVTDGHLTDAQARHIRANYGAKLSMIDHWFGELLAECDGQNLWGTTPPIGPTDGHSSRSSPDNRRESASWRSGASSATGCRSPTAATSTPEHRSVTTTRCRCGRIAGRPCRPRSRWHSSCSSHLPTGAPGWTSCRVPTFR